MPRTPAAFLGASRLLSGDVRCRSQIARRRHAFILRTQLWIILLEAGAKMKARRQEDGKARREKQRKEGHK
jgi:hypothetical protein